MLLLNGLVSDFTFAADLRGKKKPLSTLFHLPPGPNVQYSAELMGRAEDMFVSGKAGYPVERTLLVSGVLAASIESMVKQKMLDAATTDTLRSRSITGKPARMLRSAWTEEWDREDTPDPLGMPFQPILTDQALLRINRAAHHEGSGAEQLATYFVGQVVGSMNRTRGTGQVVMDMIEEFIEATEGLAGQLEV
jgi:hypothetical protein